VPQQAYGPARQVPRSRSVAAPVRLPRANAEHEPRRLREAAPGDGARPRRSIQHGAPRRSRVRRDDTLRDWLEHNVFRIVMLILLVGTPALSVLLVLAPVGSLYSTQHGSALHASVNDATNISVGGVRAGGTAAKALGSPDRTSNSILDHAAGLENGDSPASLVAREWSLFAPAREPARRLASDTTASISAGPVPTAPVARGPRLAALHPAIETMRAPVDGEARTTLVDFESAPFPYDGNVPGSNRPFLNAGEQGHRGHVNFRGHILWESQTFADSHVLLHIPPGFDARRPAVMVVYFHGHGADLARDVRDRQELPAQITAAGMNAVLVAPQFAFDAADSSAGKFWEPNGFRRFLDEAAVKLAILYGDPRSVKAFATMPIVIVAYSGGFGPTLSVLDRGGVQQRIRGLVLMDALYAGIDRFADWIANNRSTFFVSSYTPHTARHNAELEHLLDQRSVAYDSQLRRSHMQGMVAFLPTGNISHRNFVTQAWTQDPVTDILVRMDDFAPTIQTARVASAFSGRD